MDANRFHLRREVVEDASLRGHGPYSTTIAEMRTSRHPRILGVQLPRALLAGC
jgi:hypothetical protein